MYVCMHACVYYVCMYIYIYICMYCVCMYSSYFSNFRPLTYFQSDYTGCCINTIVLLRMSTELLETCRGFK